MKPKIIRTIAELRHEINHYRLNAGTIKSTVGFVPTMGYLHEGHASLLRRSAADNGLTVLSIFVNPLQFGPNEDLDKYPRDEEHDIRIASQAGTDLIFIPEVKEMYPQRNVTEVTVEEITDRLCGSSRPGHFNGVATVVTKLFNIVQPNRAYFGLKDAQQIAVISRMVRDLNIPVEIVPCPTIRENDGLALSSRNVFLGQEERRQALVLSRTLSKVTDWIAGGMTAPQLIAQIAEEIRREPLADIDYADVLNYPDLSLLPSQLPLQQASGSLIIALAVRFGKTRLIDNRLLIPVEVGEY
ncbi:pantoate--beta-alanine ligase [Cohnella sp.]|uniref:pantoate--beta-alanine ligase n=1 Tax=Cohnella sp. TaxID=1883426 RepID=UPI003563D654